MSKDICYPPNYSKILKDVLQSLPVWILELPAEAYVAEVSSRIILHPETIKFTKGSAHLNDIIADEFEKILLEKVKQTNRYKMEETLKNVSIRKS